MFPLGLIDNDMFHMEQKTRQLSLNSATYISTFKLHMSYHNKTILLCCMKGTP